MAALVRRNQEFEAQLFLVAVSLPSSLACPHSIPFPVMKIDVGRSSIR